MPELKKSNDQITETFSEVTRTGKQNIKTQPDLRQPLWILLDESESLFPELFNRNRILNHL